MWRSLRMCKQRFICSINLWAGTFKLYAADPRVSFPGRFNGETFTTAIARIILFRVNFQIMLERWSDIIIIFLYNNLTIIFFIKRLLKYTRYALASGISCCWNISENWRRKHKTVPDSDSVRSPLRLYPISYVGVPWDRAIYNAIHSRRWGCIVRIWHYWLLHLVPPATGRSSSRTAMHRCPSAISSSASRIIWNWKRANCRHKLAFIVGDISILTDFLTFTSGIFNA